MLQLDSTSSLRYLSSGRQYFRRGGICLDQGDIVNQQLSHSFTRSSSLRSDFWPTESINTYHADMDISVSVPAFFVPKHTRQVSLS